MLNENKLQAAKITCLEDELLKWKNVWRNIIKILPHSIYIKNIKSEYLWINQFSSQQLKNVHGIHFDIIGKKDSAVFPKDTAKCYIENDQATIKTKQGSVHEENVILPNGKELMRLSFKEPFYDRSKNVIGVLGCTLDVTALKEAQQKASSAEKAKNLFLDNMKHDFRVPFSGILSLGRSPLQHGI